MIRVIAQVAFLAALATCVWLGLIDGIEGARNIALFLLWLFVPFFLLAALGAAMRTEKAKPANWWIYVKRAIAAGILGMVVWAGHLVLAAALAFSVFVLVLAMQEYRT